MPPDVFHLIALLLACSFVQIDSIPPRPSCRHHYLANVYSTSVLPIQGNVDAFNVVCQMPSSADDDAFVTTEVQSGLARLHRVTDSRSVNFQIADLPMLRDLIRSSDCEQMITVTWERPPPDDRSYFTLTSLLNESLDVKYVEGNTRVEYSILAHMAGVRHILPQNWNSDILATVVASPLYCKQKVLLEPNCLFRSHILVGLKPSTSWTWEFAFRTHRSDQNLFSIHTSNSRTLLVHLERDFFLRTDSSDVPFPVHQLSDGQWHTITIHSKQGDVFFTVDDSKKIRLTELDNPESRLSAVEVELDGEILLIDPSDTSENCELNGQRKLYGHSQPKPSCSGCDCQILSGIFHDFPSFTCPHKEDEAYHLLRDPDRLSFFYHPSPSRDNLRLGLSFKSESDIGLLLFGFWQEDERKGRFQVHYRGRYLIAIYCVNNGEEVCNSCSVEKMEGFGNDQWTRVAFFMYDGEMSLVVDKDACILRDLNGQDGLSLAEVYSIPALATGSALFIGGMYYEKKKSGVYKPTFEHKFFENTREKVPSLRGCLKDVYIDGERVDLSTIFSQQLEHTLIDAGDDSAYSIQVGCPGCSPSCPAGVRCRPSEPRQITYECDCSDIEEFSLGRCRSTDRLRPNPSVPLSTAYLDSPAPVLHLASTKAALSKVWMKVSLPREVDRKMIIAEFNSLREMLFYIFVDSDGIGVHLNPSTQDRFETIVTEPVSLEDERVHLITLERKTPLGTRHASKKFNLYIDGVYNEIPDIAKYPLNNISIKADESGETNPVIIHDMGVAYEYDEHQPFLHHHSNRLHQLDVQSMLLRHRLHGPMEDVAITDPFLWRKVPSAAARSSPPGEIVPYTPDSFEPQRLLSASWLIYSLILTTALCLLLTICLVLYCCVLRRQRRRGSQASDRDRILRDSPDYSVKLRSNRTDSVSSYDGDGSIGTDDTDLNAYRDIPSHRVKVYRESMVSILVPGVDQPSEAIVKRISSVEKVSTPPLLAPSPAPLVNMNEH
uniref:LAM_G_DOMAIN domain-containing protein n=1 Tax=Haemonchus contortus TaxID=6289 RepID=A0A7I5E5J2_HAECO|nr:CRE-BAM-2 protein [Haemonchus contortus]